MKQFVLWLVLVIVIFGAVYGTYHVYLTRHPRKIIVAIDSSYAMQPVWPKISDVLNELNQKPYAQFCLITDKTKIHSWQSKLTIDRIMPYAPRNLANVNSEKYPEMNEATQKYLLTNATKNELTSFSHWQIISLK